MTDFPKRRTDLAASFGELHVDAMLVTDESNVRYLTGFTGDSSYLLVRDGNTVMVSDGRYETQIASECPDIDCIIRPPSQLLMEATRVALDSLAGQSRRVAIEADVMSLASYRWLAEQCQGIELVETSGVVARQRMIKDESEIAITRKAVQIAEAAFVEMRDELSREMSERTIAYALEAKMRTLGAEGCSFDPIVAAGAAGALPHYFPSDQTIGDANTLLIDWGARYLGYASDLTRTLHTADASRAFCKAYDAVLEAQLAAIEAIGPGVRAADVDKVARDVLDRAGLGDAFKHGLGHGTGLQIHELPRLSSTSDETLECGMIVTVEPGVYFEGDFGIRIEDDVLVTPTGREVLSGLPKGLDDGRLIL